MGELLTPAAQYLRTSTDRQPCSLHHQAICIRAYAEKMGCEVVKTYSDNWKSGLTLNQRPGLQQLLADVMSGSVRFRMILVYDVSRWGRFQDIDESAHYEFLCKQAGIPVHYCAESFRNEETPLNRLMKTLKRSMAAEYSRDLSQKIWAAQRRLARCGYSQGGMPGFGLRRLLVSSEREPKRIMNFGERKGIQTDRVIFVPGPPEEVETVRKMFQMLTEQHKGPHRIAQELNERGFPRIGSPPWSATSVTRILNNPRYAGCFRFGRRTQRLGSTRHATAREQWVLARGALEPIIDTKTFDRGQQILSSATVNLSNDDLLEKLRKLLRNSGKLTAELVDSSPQMPCAETYRKRFGTLEKAFALAGYQSHSFGCAKCRLQTQGLREELLRRVQATAPTEISIIHPGPRKRSCLRLRNGRIISVYVCSPLYTPRGHISWAFDPIRRELRHIALLGLLSMDKNEFVDYYIVPKLPNEERMHVSLNSPWLKAGAHLFRLKDFVKIATQIGAFASIVATPSTGSR